MANSRLVEAAAPKDRLTKWAGVALWTGTMALFVLAQGGGAIFQIMASEGKEVAWAMASRVAPVLTVSFFLVPICAAIFWKFKARWNRFMALGVAATDDEIRELAGVKDGLPKAKAILRTRGLEKRENLWLFLEVGYPEKLKWLRGRSGLVETLGRAAWERFSKKWRRGSWLVVGLLTGSMAVVALGSAVSWAYWDRAAFPDWVMWFFLLWPLICVPGYLGFLSWRNVKNVGTCLKGLPKEDIVGLWEVGLFSKAIFDAVGWLAFRGDGKMKEVKKLLRVAERERMRAASVAIGNRPKG